MPDESSALDTCLNESEERGPGDTPHPPKVSSNHTNTLHHLVPELRALEDHAGDLSVCVCVLVCDCACISLR